MSMSWTTKEDNETDPDQWDLSNEYNQCEILIGSCFRDKTVMNNITGTIEILWINILKQN